jgi:hypothetical protein
MSMEGGVIGTVGSESLPGGKRAIMIEEVTECKRGYKDDGRKRLAADFLSCPPRSVSFTNSAHLSTPRRLQTTSRCSKTPPDNDH